MFSIFLLHIIIIILVLYLPFLFKKKLNINNSNINEQIDVIIPLRNEENNIKQLLYSIENLKLFPNHFYFINDHSDDKTFEIIKNSKINNYTIINLVETYGKKCAIKEGFYNSKSNFILTIDGDSYLQKDFFKNLNKINCADLTILPIKMKLEKIYKYFFDLDFYYLNSISHLLSNYNIFIQASGANLLIKRTLFKEYIKNDKFSNYSSGDDYFLLKFANKNKYEIQNILDPNLYNEVKNPPKISQLFHQRIRWIGKTIKTSTYLISFSTLILVYLYLIFILSTIYSNFFLSITLKIIFDFIVLLPYLLITRDLIKTILLPIFSLIQLPYYMIILIFSTFTNAKWKGRYVNN